MEAESPRSWVPGVGNNLGFSPRPRSWRPRKKFRGGSRFPLWFPWCAPHLCLGQAWADGKGEPANMPPSRGLRTGNGLVRTSPLSI